MSGLNHAAYGLPVNASRPGSPQAHASLGSGWRPTLAGWDWIPTGFRTRFQRSHHGILSPLTGLSRHTRWCTNTVRRFEAADQTERMQSRIPPKYKTKYRVKNWASYDRALVRRGDIAAWEPDRAGTRGAQRKYSDLAIESALTLRLLLHLPLRQVEGFLRSLFVLMGFDLRGARSHDLVPPCPVPRSRATARAKARGPSPHHRQQWSVDRRRW